MEHFFVSRQHRLCRRWPWRTSIISKLFIYTMSGSGFYSKLYFTMESLEIMLKIILIVNFKRCLISSSLFEASKSVFSLLIGFTCSVIVVFCRCLCTCLWSLCWRRCLRCAKRCSLCFAVVFFDPLAMNFSRRSPEEFRWKILAGEDFQPLVVLAFPCHFQGKLLMVHRSKTLFHRRLKDTRRQSLFCLETKNASWRNTTWRRCRTPTHGTRTSRATRL